MVTVPEPRPGHNQHPDHLQREEGGSLLPIIALAPGCQVAKHGLPRSPASLRADRVGDERPSGRRLAPHQLLGVHGGSANTERKVLSRGCSQSPGPSSAPHTTGQGPPEVGWGGLKL